MLPAAPGAAPQVSTPAPAESEAGFKICLVGYGDGTFQVYEEPFDGGAAPAPEMQNHGAMLGEEAGETERIDDLEGALKAVYGLAMEKSRGGDEAEMESGFDEGLA